ncbi:MAG: hypothetical protein KY393_01275 [Actinobacteria bacterium]|nr:hypothetical protein [Actinomycetota bacterium]
MTSRKSWKVVAAAAFMALGSSVLLVAGPLHAAGPEPPSTHGGDRDMQHMMDGMSMEEMMSMMGDEDMAAMWSMMGSGKTGGSMGGDVMHGSSMGGGMMGNTPKGGNVMDDCRNVCDTMGDKSTAD